MLAVFEYIERMFGNKTEYEIWDKTSMLPNYLRAEHIFWVLKVFDIKCLVMQTKQERFNLASLKKQFKQLLNYTDYSIVLYFDNLTNYRRNVLIQNRIPFIVSEKQLFLPFLGVALQEYNKTEIQTVDKLSANAQFVLLFLIYNSGTTGFPEKELAQRLSISAMTISRAVRELENTRLVKIEKTGKKMVIFPETESNALYEKAKPYLCSPIRKKIFIKNVNKASSLTIAGLEALSEKSFLNHPGRKIRAVNRKEYKEIITEADVVDAAWDDSGDAAEIEIWNYDPKLLAKNNIADPISVALSLKDSKDERITGEIEKMLEDL